MFQFGGPCCTYTLLQYNHSNTPCSLCCPRSTTRAHWCRNQLLLTPAVWYAHFTVHAGQANHTEPGSSLNVSILGTHSLRPMSPVCAKPPAARLGPHRLFHTAPTSGLVISSGWLLVPRQHTGTPRRRSTSHVINYHIVENIGTRQQLAVCVFQQRCTRCTLMIVLSNCLCRLRPCITGGRRRRSRRPR